MRNLYFSFRYLFLSILLAFSKNTSCVPQSVAAQVANVTPLIPTKKLAFSLLFPEDTKSIQRLVADATSLMDTEIDSIINQRDARTFINTMLPIDLITGRMSCTISILRLITLVHPDATMREHAAQGLTSLERHLLDKLTLNSHLYKVVKTYATDQKRNNEVLSTEQIHYINTYIESAKQVGLELSSPKKAAVKKIMHDLGRLEGQFEKNISEDSCTLTLHPTELAGLENTFIASLKKQGDDTYHIPLHKWTYRTIMRQCNVAHTREKAWLAYQNRAYPANRVVLEKIISLRDRLARLVGYNSYAHLTISRKMARTETRVKKFLDTILERARIQHLKETRQILSRASVQGLLAPDGKVKPWDISYVMRREIAKKPKQTKEYFPTLPTIDAVGAIYHCFLGVEFRREKIPHLWHPDVASYGLYDSDGTCQGYIILDLYKRKHKFTRSRVLQLMPAISPRDGTKSPGVAVIITNFPHTKDKTNFLTIEQVATLFHEFGHAVHALLSATTLTSFAGLNAKTDFIEIISQMFTKWAYNPYVLKRISQHYITGKSLDEATIRQICRAEQKKSARSLYRRIANAQLALAIFTHDSSKHYHKIVEEIYTTLFPEIYYDNRVHPLCSFGPLGRKRYAAAYYSYLWSDVFAQDLFDTIQKEGLCTTATGKRFTEKILTHGGSRDPIELLTDFLGHKPRTINA